MNTKFLLPACLTLLCAPMATAIENPALQYYRSDFSGANSSNPLAGWSCFGSGKTAQNIYIGNSSEQLRRYFPAGAPAYVPINFGEFGIIFCSNSTTDEGGSVNEWLVSPEIDLTDVQGNMILSFDTFAYGNDNDPKYEVYYSTAGDTADDFAGNRIFSARSDNSASEAVLTRKHVSLSDFGGRKVRLAFVNTSRNAQILGFKDITLSEYDLEVTNHTPTFVNDAGSYKVRLTLDLMTPVPCEGFTATLSGDQWAEPQVYTTKKQLNSASTSTIVEFPQPIELADGGSVSYRVSIIPAYEGASESVFDFDISCAKGYPSVCVEEEATGTWCGYCVRGIAGLNQFSNEYKDRFIGIAVHGENDPMMVDSYIKGLKDQSGITGYPSAWYNRTRRADPYDRESVNNLLSVKTGYKVDIDRVDFDPETSLVSVAYSPRMVFSTSSANITAVAVVTEDGVKGSTIAYNQTNYYAGASLTQIETAFGAGSWEYFKFFCQRGTSIPYTEMTYDHVARGIFNSYAGGGDGAGLPAVWEADRPQQFTLKFNMPATVDDWRNTHIVVMLLDGVTGQVLNAAKTGADDFAVASITAPEAEAWSVTADGSAITVTTPADAVVTVHNLLGHRFVSTAVSAGTTAIDTAGLTGTVVVGVRSGSTSYVKKIILK